jgi:hypothetical protein
VTTPASHAAAAAAHTAAIPPHLAGSLVSLRDMIDVHWPHRDRSSDGGLGDARHQAENGPEGPGSGSDHNPWLHNTVRAYDFTAKGIDPGWLAEQLRILGHYGDPRLVGGGYVVWDHQITAPDFSHWQPYDGTDPHVSHVHVSVTRNSPAFEYGGIWSFLATKPTPRQQPLPVPAATPAPHVDPVTPTGHDATGRGDDFRADIGDAGPEVKELQHDLDTYAPAYSHLEEDGVYGQHTAEVVAEFAHREALDPTTPPADRPGLAAADGRNVGPRLATALRRDGLI